MNASRSSIVSESALAITGTTLTTSDNFLRTTISIGFKLYQQNLSFINIYIINLRMTGRCNKEQTTVNAGIDNITFTSSCQLFTQVSRVLVFNILDNGFPTNLDLDLDFFFFFLGFINTISLPIIIINLISITWCIHNIKSQSNTVFLNGCLS